MNLSTFIKSCDEYVTYWSNCFYHVLTIYHCMSFIPLLWTFIVCHCSNILNFLYFWVSPYKFFPLKYKSYDYNWLETVTCEATVSTMSSRLCYYMHIML